MNDSGNLHLLWLGFLSFCHFELLLDADSRAGSVPTSVPQ